MLALQNLSILANKFILIFDAPQALALCCSAKNHFDQGLCKAHLHMETAEAEPNPPRTYESGVMWHTVQY